MNRQVKFLIVLLLAECCPGCKSPTGPQASPEFDIREAVYRYQFYTNGSGTVAGGQVSSTVHFYFLALALTDSMLFVPRQYYDPPDDFISRFSVPIPKPVSKFSAATMNRGGIVYDTQSGQQGILFYTGILRRLSDTQAQVEGGYYFNGRNAEGDIFYLHFGNSRWSVDSVMYRWVS